MWGQRVGSQAEPKHEKNLRRDLKKASVRHDLSIGKHGGVHARCSEIGFPDLPELIGMFQLAKLELNAVAFGHSKLPPGTWHAKAKLERTIAQPESGDTHHPDAGDIAVSLAEEAHSNLAWIHIESKTKPDTPRERVLSIRVHSPQVTQELVGHYRDAIKELLTHALGSLDINDSPIADTEVVVEQEQSK